MPPLYTNPLADGFEESTDAVLDGHFRLWWLKSNSKQILSSLSSDVGDYRHSTIKIMYFCIGINQCCCAVNFNLADYQAIFEDY